MRAIDADKLCIDLMERWDIADKQKDELVRQVMANIVTPIVVSQPTIEPERETGKWLDDFNEGYKCSECGAYLEIDCGDTDMNFCPNCGARMEGVERNVDVDA